MILIFHMISILKVLKTCIATDLISIGSSATQIYPFVWRLMSPHAQSSKLSVHNSQHYRCQFSSLFSGRESNPRHLAYNVKSWSTVLWTATYFQRCNLYVVNIASSLLTQPISTLPLELGESHSTGSTQMHAKTIQNSHLRKVFTCSHQLMLPLEHWKFTLLGLVRTGKQRLVLTWLQWSSHQIMLPLDHWMGFKLGFIASLGVGL